MIYFNSFIVYLTLFGLSAAFDFTVKKEQISGKVFRTLIVNNPPMLTVKKLDSGNYSIDGITCEVMEWMQHYFQLIFHLVYIDFKDVTKYGFELAMFRQLEMNAVDLIPFLLEVSLKNIKLLSYMQPLVIDNTLFLQPFPSAETRIKTLIKPFDSEVWVCFIGSALSLIVVLSSFTILKYHNISYAFSQLSVKASSSSTRGNKNHALLLWKIVMNQMEYIITTITSQGNYIKYSSRTSLRLVIASWLLSMVVLVYAYTGVFTSILAIPKFEPVINSFDELVKSPRFKLTMDKQTEQIGQYLEATSGPYKVIGDDFRNNPELLFGDVFQMIENILHRDCVFATTPLFARYIILEDKKASGKCRMTTSNKYLPKMVPFQVGVPKGSPDATLLDNLSLRWISAGMVIYLGNKYFPTTPQCQADIVSPRDHESIPIKLVDLEGIFAVLLIGYAMSLLCFILENIVWNIKTAVLFNLKIRVNQF